MSDTPDWVPDPRPVPAELEPNYRAVPPDHTINPADLDEDQHPTSAWLTIGDVVDTDVWKRIREQLRAEMQEGAS